MEISEVEETYKQFYELIDRLRLRVRERNALESALFELAIEAEMQGFIYGFKLYGALSDKQLKSEG